MEEQEQVIIMGESVKLAITNELIKNFQGVSIYKEKRTEPNFPNFFVYQITTDSTHQRNNVYSQEYLMSVQYFASNDLSTHENLNMEIDDIAYRITQLKRVYFGDIPVKILNGKINKEDGVLNYIFTIKFIQNEILVENAVKMQTLDVEFKMKEK